jgi:formylglycine-generating enzyme required for sulfatase activity
MQAAPATAIALLLAASACALPVGGEGPEPTKRDAGVGDTGATSHDAEGPDAPGLDASGSDSSSAPDAPIVAPDGAVACPNAHDPPMVPVGSFCIDVTEVTQSQYQQFLASIPLTGTQPAICLWNLSFVPSGQWPPTMQTDDVPVTSVDWCDARAYCAWAGKRLCGQIGGGSLPTASVNVAAESQWYFACSHDDDGQHVFPYGNTYGPNTCNGGDANGGVQLVEAASAFPACIGGYPSLYDMSGNVREWEDACMGTAGAMDQCNQRGGSVNDGAGQLTCSTTDLQPRNSSNDHLGFRCCSQ